MRNFVLFLFLLLLTFQYSSSSRWRWNPRGTNPEFSVIRMFLFNVTNPEETINGGKPNLQEIGPYVYRERRDRFNISTTLMSTVKYQENKTYEFVRELSGGNENDQINFVNIPLVSALSSLLNVPFIGFGMVDKLLKTNEQFVRQGVNVGDFLYNGIDVQLYINILDTLDQSIPPQMAGGKFGIFKGKNGTDEGVVEVQEKPDYLHNIGELVSFQNQTLLTTWHDKECNRLRGSTGEVFSPGIGKATVLYYFNHELCRSFPFVYQRDEEFKGIPGYRFIFPENMLEYAKIKEENICYCKNYDPDDFEPDYSSCLKKGVLDLTLCRKAPLASSFPHFLDADPSYIDMVHGLHPSREAHESFILVEPKTGTVLNSSVRFQLNVQTSALTRISALKKIPRYLFPVMWGDKSFTMDDETAAEMLKSIESGEEIAPANDGSNGLGSVNSDLNSALNTLPIPVLTILSILAAYIL